MEVFKNDQRGKTRLTPYWKNLLKAASSFRSCLLRACPPLTCCVQHKPHTTLPCSCLHTDHTYGMDPTCTLFKSAVTSCPLDGQQACHDLTTSFPSYAFGMQDFNEHEGHRNLSQHCLTLERKVSQRLRARRTPGSTQQSPAVVSSQSAQTSLSCLVAEHSSLPPQQTLLLLFQGSQLCCFKWVVLLCDPRVSLQ